MAGRRRAQTTISIRSRPVFGPARKSRSFNQSSPRPAVRTELPTLDSSTRTKTFKREAGIESFFCTARSVLSTLNNQLLIFSASIHPPAPTLGNQREYLNFSFVPGYKSTADIGKLL